MGATTLNFLAHLASAVAIASAIISMIFATLMIWNYFTIRKHLKVAAAREEEMPNPFQVGDRVVLKSAKNPYKGTLRCGEVYHVISVGGKGILLRAANGTAGYFYYNYFEKDIGPDPSAVNEYYEILQIQELADEI